MKVLALIVYALVLTVSPTDVSEIRQRYPEAITSEEITNELYHILNAVEHKDNKTLVAYKGAVLTLMAKHTQGLKEKKDFFKKGAKLIEYAVKAEPENIEIRYIRLGVQENSPKIVGYKDSISEDKQFILDHYRDTSMKAVKEYIKDFALQSSLFDQEEKQLF